MRFSFLTFSLCLVAMCLSSAAKLCAMQPVATPVVVSPELAVSPELIKAYRDLQLAQLELRQYRFVELPRQRRWIDDQITLAEIQARELNRRVQDYRPSLQFRSDNTPLRNAAENYRLELLATQQRLRQLKNQRIQLWRIGREGYRLRALKIKVEAMRLISLKNITPKNTKALPR